MGIIKEHHIQVQLIQYLKTFYPELLIFSIPNGANVNPVNRVNLIKEGLLSGVPDLFLAQANNQYHGLFIEMKRDKGTISPSQKKVMSTLIENGYQCVVCHNVQEAIDNILNYLTKC